jgi:hypothetical protein
MKCLEGVSVAFATSLLPKFNSSMCGTGHTAVCVAQDIQQYVWHRTYSSMCGTGHTVHSSMCGTGHTVHSSMCGTGHTVNNS